MNIESRLLEYAEWLHEPGMQFFPAKTVEARLMDEGAGASHQTSQQSDGGLGAMVDRMARDLARDKRCREMAEAMQAMRQVSVDHYNVIEALYGGHWRDMPRSLEGASLVLGIKIGTFRQRRIGALAWLSGRLMLSVDKSAQAA